MIRNPFKRHRIDYLLFGSFACLFAILLVVVITVSYRYTSHELVKNTSYYQQELLNQLNKQIYTQLNSIEQLSLSATRNVTLRDFLSYSEDNFSRYRQSREVSSYLVNLVYSIGALESIDLYVARPPDSSEGIPVTFKSLADQSKEQWFPLLERADFIWLPGRQIAVNGRPKSVISFARKIYSDSGKSQGAIVFNMKSSAIQSLLGGEHEGGARKPDLRLMMDFNGTIITSVGEYPDSPDTREYVRRLIGNSRLGYAYARLGPLSDRAIGDSLVVWSQLFNTNWLLVEVTPWKQTTQGSVKIAAVLLVAGLIVIVVALGLTLLLSKQFTKPIRILVREMSRFNKTNARGGSGALFPQDYKNEFGIMFSVYGKMLDRIEELYRSLENRYIRQKETEILTLQAMINPHFLYNTLDQLNWMAIEAGHDDMSRVLELMGRMFRIGLSNGEYMIAISDELEHIRCYLEVQQIRLGDSVTCEIDMPESLLSLYILKLTLQPFIENAVMHGRSGAERVHIRIHGTETAAGILITIADDGSGMNEDWRKRKPRKTGGYGIRNVKERIDAYFNGPYGIRIRSEPGRGTQVSILLPKIENLHQWRGQHVESGDH